MDENRRRTLLALIDLASDSNPNACWDDQRAIELLRRESTPDELRDLGASTGIIEVVFPEQHGA